jgi:hypothetical protein
VAQRPVLTLEPPFHKVNGIEVTNSFFTSYHQQVDDASRLLYPKACDSHLVYVLFDMTLLNQTLATILDHIPVMSDSQLECYDSEFVKLIAWQQQPYGRCRERKIGVGVTVQLRVALLRVRGGINCPAPPPEPVVFFTTVSAGTAPIAYPILLPAPFIPNPLYTASQREDRLYEQSPYAASLASVTLHHLKTESESDSALHWHTATHNSIPSASDVKTVFIAPADSSSVTTATSAPLVYRYLSNNLNTLQSSSPIPLREQNIMSAVIDTFTRARLSGYNSMRCYNCMPVSHPPSSRVFVMVL